jgi:hypothetical protein
MMAKKNQAAVSLGRKGGKARAITHSAEELSEAGKAAIKARWDAYYRLHPEKLKAKLARQAKKKAGEEAEGEMRRLRNGRR